MYKGEQRFAHCRGVSKSADCGLAFWNKWEQGQLGATAPANPQLNPAGFCDSLSEAPYSTIGDQLKAIIQRETGIEIPCEACRQRIARLNSMSRDEAMNSETRRQIVDEISQQASAGVGNWIQRLGIAFDAMAGTGLLRSNIERWYDEAVDAGTTNVSKTSAAVAVVVANRNQTVVAPQAPAWERPARRKAGAEQDRLHRIAVSSVPLKRQWQCESRPKVNLVYHLWPRKGLWERHLQRLQQLIALCDGRVIVGISTDAETDRFEDVAAAVWPAQEGRVHWLPSVNIRHNQGIWSRGARFGELQTAIPAMELLRDLPEDSVTLYAHGKGMQDHTFRSNAVRVWTDIMYESIMFPIDKTIETISSGYECVGNFRTFGLRPLMCSYKWHYAGTFYAFRTRALVNSSGVAKYQMRYGGTEAWLGDHIRPSMAACEFADNSPIIRQYDDNLMTEVAGDYLRYESMQHGNGPKLEQHRREWAWFLRQVSDVKSMLIIGSRFGGMEHHLRNVFAEMRLVSVDLDPDATNKTDCLVIGDSHNSEIQDLLRNRGPFDAVFIDGDHTYDGVKLDFEFACSLNPRYVFLHDITNDIYHQATGCQVERLWKEIVSDAGSLGWATDSFAVGCGWGGIGKVIFRA